jgi:hypothetical protein
MNNLLLPPLQKRHHLALIGEAQMGKTTLLQQLRQILWEDFGNNRILPVFFDPARLDKTATLTDFFKLLLEETLNAVNQKFHRSLSLTEIEFPAFFENDLINDFVAPSLDEIRRQVPSPYFYFLWIVDDIGDLTQFLWSGSLFSLLRALLYSSRKMHEIILLLSGTPNSMESVVTATGSPLGNLMEIHYLNVLNKAESQSLILQELSGREYEQCAVLEIVRQTGGQPYLLRTLLEYLQNEVRGLITIGHVADAAKAFSRENTLFAEWFRQFSKTDKQIYQALLTSEKPLSCTFFSRWGAHSVILRPLTLLGVISQTDDGKFCQLNIEMFKDWVQEHGSFS